MEVRQEPSGDMNELVRMLETALPVTEIKLDWDDTHLDIDLQESITNKAASVKAIDALVRPYIESHGNPEQEYQVRVRKGRELLDILNYNDPDAAYFITMEIFGKEQDLRIQDVLGATGDYTIFNGDFESLGQISAVGVPAEEHLLNTDEEDPDAYYIDHVYPDFSNPKIWKAFPDTLEPYVPELLAKILSEINRNYTPDRLNVDDPEDLLFWADQFQISQDELRKATLAVGNSIDDITAYLQK